MQVLTHCLEKLLGLLELFDGGFLFKMLFLKISSKVLLHRLSGMESLFSHDFRPHAQKLDQTPVPLNAHAGLVPELSDHDKPLFGFVHPPQILDLHRSSRLFGLQRLNSHQSFYLRLVVLGREKLVLFLFGKRDAVFFIEPLVNCDFLLQLRHLRFQLILSLAVFLEKVGMALLFQRAQGQVRDFERVFQVLEVELVRNQLLQALPELLFPNQFLQVGVRRLELLARYWVFHRSLLNLLQLPSQFYVRQVVQRRANCYSLLPCLLYDLNRRDPNLLESFCRRGK